MSEPGRYFTSESTMLICNIIARRTHNKDYSSEEELECHTQIMKEDDEKYLIRNAEILYYINDGIYGTFNAIIFDQKLFFVNYMRKDMKRENEEEEEQEYKSVLFGPTCDGIDCIANSISLPLLNIGDYLWFSNVGSYTNSCASNFNGFKIKKYFFIWKS
jgi:ornithine decarboxylase